VDLQKEKLRLDNLRKIIIQSSIIIDFVRCTQLDLKEIRRRIYGDILASDDIGKALKKWREFFKVTQSELSREMNVTSSVISDYERGRQRYPGTKFIKKYVEALIRIDMERGESVLKVLSQGEKAIDSKCILDIYEYDEPIPAWRIIELTESEVIANERLLNSPLYGHTVLDSILTILTLSGSLFYSIYGASSERALIFTKVTLGRSPMVAVRVYPLKPRLVILHTPSKVDDLAVEIATREKIILAISHASSVDRLLRSLESLKKKE